ncbi:MAG TPA: cytidine deaminase [Syntrophomonadaceae bacterium]|jgi:cytidine deaminase|nr:cytidine deaminase [Syntrophomonadaceae bacterium]HPU48762.1 cytidine deaminase [Syntrophomonadaceae bacterium]
MDEKELIKIARQVQPNAYVPYSHFSVGAALLTARQNVYTGVNVENSSYGLTVCAERNAVFKAISEGEKQFEAIAVAGSAEGFTYPCGACLQVLAEFNPDLKIIVCDRQNNIKVHSLRELLPQMFLL